MVLDFCDQSDCLIASGATDGILTRKDKAMKPTQVKKATNVLR